MTIENDIFNINILTNRKMLSKTIYYCFIAHTINFHKPSTYITVLKDNVN